MFPRDRQKVAVDEFRRLRASGCQSGNERLELIEGELVTHPSASAQRLVLRERLAQALSAALEGRADVRTEQAISLSYLSEPVVDLCVVRKSSSLVKGGPVQPSDILLAVEITDQRQTLLRRVKAPACLEAGIGDLWIVDPVGQYVESLRSRRVARQGDWASVAQFPGLRLRVSDLF